MGLYHLWGQSATWICTELFCTGRSSLLSHLFTYSIFYFYSYGLMFIYFIVCIVIQYCCVLFLRLFYLGVFTFGCSVALTFFHHFSLLLFLFEHFLTFWPLKCFSVFSSSFFVVILGFELRASHVLGRRCISWVTPLALYCDGYFRDRVSWIFTWTGFELWSSWSLPSE
jgi:hypothetical protein